MPMYLCCSFKGCYNKTPQSHMADEDQGGLWYCDWHKTQEQRECDFSGCNHPGHYTDAKITGSYCLHHRRVMMDIHKSTEHNTETEKLKEALDAAEFALNSLVSLSCSCSFEYGLTEEGEHEHAPLCSVLIAQNALKEIKAKLET